MTFLNLTITVVVLGVSSFVAGLLPLSISLSRERLGQLSTLGTGLLLGAAMGVIIPEGIEAIYDSASRKKASNRSSAEPSFHIAFSLISGFVLMYSLEHFVTPYLASRSPHNHSYATAPAATHTHDMPLSPTTPSMAGLDLDDEIEMELNALGVETRTSEVTKNPNMLTIGLIIHSCADGLALGAASALSFSQSAEGASPVSEKAAGLSFVVFMAIAIHKAPTALALTSTLMTRIPARRVKHHLVAFSLASPLSAIATYAGLTLLGGPAHLEDWTGNVLMFSGGTFLYVATVLSSLPAHSHGDATANQGDGGNTSRLMQAGLTAGGMFIPLIMSRLFGHGH